MPPTLSETILGGAGIAMITAIVTKLAATRNVVKKDDCVARQGACMMLVKSELEHIKESVGELKEGQKESQKTVMEVLTELRSRAR